MERLTKRLGDYNNPKEICAVWVKNHDYVGAAHRLADYEDIADAVGGFDRLRELAEADRDGRLVVLSHKVGDELWTFCSHPVEQVYSFTVTDIVTLNGRTMLDTSRCGVIDACDVGKNVFLTREEAEKALKVMKNE